MIIATIDYKEKKTLLIGFILIKFLDSISYYRVFKYLYENYGFNPLVIHTDYEISLAKAIKHCEFFSKDLIHLRCMFHFVQAIRRKCQQIGLAKKKLSKNVYELISNIELICLINYDRVTEYQKFLINNLQEKKEYIKLCKYLKEYWFSKNISEYNFSQFINKYKQSKDKMDMIYLTNNIIESINSRINFYLPKKITNELNFIKSINNILLNDSINNNNNNHRYDYKTRSLLFLIEKEELNNYFKWIKFDMFKHYLRMIIKNNTNFIERGEGESDKLFKLIGEDISDLDEDKENDENGLNLTNSNLNQNNSKDESDSSFENEIEENLNVDLNNAENLDNFVKNFQQLNIKEEKEGEKNVDRFKDQIIIDKEKEEEDKKGNNKDLENNKEYFHKEDDSNNMDIDSIEKNKFLMPLGDRIKDRLKNAVKNCKKKTNKKKEINYPKKCRKRKKSYSDEDIDEYEKNSIKRKKSLPKQKKKRMVIMSH